MDVTTSDVINASDNVVSSVEKTHQLPSTVNVGSKSFDQASKLDPADADKWNNKDVILSKLEHFEEALKAYDKALELDPTDSDTWYNKGHALFRLERFTEALSCFDLFWSWIRRMRMVWSGV